MEYTLNINLNEIQTKEDKAKTDLNVATNKTKETNATKSKVKNSGKTLKILKAAGAVQLSRTVVNTGVQYANYRIGTISARYGDTARQNKLNNMMTIANETTNALGTIAATALSGAAVGGPIGAAVGAVIGTVSATITQGLKMTERKDQWNLNQDKNNMNEIRMNERIGMMSSDRNRGK